MTRLISTDRFVRTPHTCATQGRITVAPLKTLWLAGHSLLGLTAILAFPSLNAALIFTLLTAITICAGHSVGMHRLLIHRSFETYRPIEYTLVWLGVLVGMAGPIGMIRTHDLRDWHQRQTICPPHPSHAAGFWRDAWWQLCCEFRLTHPPAFTLEPRIANDPTYRLIEATWMLHQIPLALALYALGGWAFVLWGISMRISVSLIGHWAVGHFAHRRGSQGWIIQGLPVQGYNLPGLGLLTFGENWHDNHHAFPHSARLGVDPGQTDPGFWLIRSLQSMGLAWNVKTPSSDPPRAGLTRLAPPP